MGSLDLRPHIEKFRRRFAEVEAALNDPKVFENNQRAQELAREYARLKDLVAHGENYLKTLADLEENRKLLAGDDAEMAEMAKEEITRLQTAEKKLEGELQHGIIPPDPSDSRNTIIEIRAGAGGSESALFAADLYRMYMRYADAQGWKVETMDASPSDLGGYKEIIFAVTGTDVFKRLKYESGVHRVQRVPATEAQGRIHTSTATVAVSGQYAYSKRLPASQSTWPCRTSTRSHSATTRARSPRGKASSRRLTPLAASVCFIGQYDGVRVRATVR